MVVPSQDSLNKPFGASRPEIARVQLLLKMNKLHNQEFLVYKQCINSISFAP
jgi:hypothetical protein